MDRVGFYTCFPELECAYFSCTDIAHAIRFCRERGDLPIALHQRFLAQVFAGNEFARDDDGTRLYGSCAIAKALFQSTPELHSQRETFFAALLDSHRRGGVEWERNEDQLVGAHWIETADSARHSA